MMKYTTKALAALAAAAGVVNARPLTAETSVVAKRDFNAGGSNNLVAWWGNSDKTGTAGLDQVCAADYDIVILTFAIDISSEKVTVGGGAEGQAVAASIKKCQSSGKKVFMSIGGATGHIIFQSDSDATSAAQNVAKAFLTDGSYYGLKLDGIDLDNETGNSQHYDTFVSALRKEMSGNQYISGAPQCPFPDASLDPTTLNEMDFVWVQFYNNPPCGLGTAGFTDSVKQWSKALTKPKFYIASPGSQTSAGSGYLEPDKMSSTIADVVKMGLSNFGGVAIWDASTALLNNNYQDVIKKALGGGSSSPSGPSSAAPSSPAAAPSGTTPATGAPTGAPTGGATPTTHKGHGQQTDPATTVKATSTAHVTSTAFIPSGTAPASVPTAAPTGAFNNGTSTNQPCSDAGKVVCSSNGQMFGICDGSSAVMMSVAQGTTCTNGQIAAVDTPSAAAGDDIPTSTVATDGSGVSGAPSAGGDDDDEGDN